MFSHGYFETRRGTARNGLASRLLQLSDQSVTDVTRLAIRAGRDCVIVVDGLSVDSFHPPPPSPLRLALDQRYFTPAMEHEIDGWIAQLGQCKQLSEADVKKLCDKVRLLISIT